MNQTLTESVIAWYRTSTTPVAVGIQSATAVVAWLALTVLFTVGGVSLTLAGVEAVIRPETPAFTLLAFAGALSVISASPLLAEVTVRRTLRGIAAGLGSVTATVEDGSVYVSPTSNREPRCKSCCA